MGVEDCAELSGDCGRRVRGNRAIKSRKKVIMRPRRQRRWWQNEGAEDMLGITRRRRCGHGEGDTRDGGGSNRSTECRRESRRLVFGIDGSHQAGH